jgi:hypothetical protein
MYLDAKGLVTTGTGDLINSYEAAKALPWKLNGRPVTKDLVKLEFYFVKNLFGKKHPTLNCTWNEAGGGRFSAVTQLRLDWDYVDRMFYTKAKSFYEKLCKRFPGFEDTPVSAQMAVMLMAWAGGPGFNFPKFAKAFNERDWETCAKECTFKGGGTIVDRNKLIQDLFYELIIDATTEPGDLYHSVTCPTCAGTGVIFEYLKD